MILYHKRNLVYAVFNFSKRIIECREVKKINTDVWDSGHYYFVEKLKIVEKNLCKLNC